MSNAGDDKGKRGLFRRARPSTKPDATPVVGNPGRRAPEPKRSGDMFARRGREDAWSQSAWDDDGWDDDFSDRSRRASIRPAADPKPEAVDAWLTSDKDDFDDITRDIAVKWSGKEPAATQTLPAGATWDPLDPPETGTPAAETSLDARHESAAVTADALATPDLLPPPEFPEIDDDLDSQLDENPPEDFSSEEILAEESSMDDLPSDDLPSDDLPSDDLDSEDLTAEYPGPDGVSEDHPLANIDGARPVPETHDGVDDGSYVAWESTSAETPEPVPGTEAAEDSGPGTVESRFAPVESASDVGTDESVSETPSASPIVVGPDGERDLFLEDLYAELDDVAPPHKVSGYHPPAPVDAFASAEAVVETEPVEVESGAVDALAPQFEVASADDENDAVAALQSTTTTFAHVDTASPEEVDAVDEIDDDATQLLDIADIPVAPTKPGATFEVSDDLPEFAPDFAPLPASESDHAMHDHVEPDHRTHDHDEDDDTFPALTSRGSFVDTLDDDHHENSLAHDSHDWDVPEAAAVADAHAEADDRMADDRMVDELPEEPAVDARPYGSLAPTPAPSARPTPADLAPAAQIASNRSTGEATPRYAPVSPLSAAGAAASTRVLTTAGLGLVAVESVRMLGDVASALSTSTSDRLGSLDPLHRVGQVFADLGVTHGAVLTLGVGLLALPQLLQRRLSDKAATKTGLGLGLALISGIIGVVGGIAALRTGVRANDAANVDTNFGTMAHYVANVLATTGASLVAMITAFRTLDLSDSQD